MVRMESVDDKTCVTLLFYRILTVHWGTKLSHAVQRKNANCRVLLIRHVCDITFLHNTFLYNIVRTFAKGYTTFTDTALHGKIAEC